MLGEGRGLTDGNSWFRRDAGDLSQRLKELAVSYSFNSLGETVTSSQSCYVFYMVNDMPIITSMPV